MPWKFREQSNEWVRENMTNWGNYSFQIFVELNDAKNQQDKYSSTALRIEFGRSTDFYGRIVIYSLEVWGVEAEK